MKLAGTHREVHQDEQHARGQKNELDGRLDTHMVEQPITMDARKAKMGEEMMQLMQMGKESLSQCPMMKGLKGLDKKSGDAQKEQK
ncbi:MAG: hypothetical protein R6V60_22500 [Desulfobacterales bacterium]